MATALVTTQAFVGIQKVLAAGNISTVQGGGQGRFSCASGISFPSSFISFRADKQSGKITGTFNIGVFTGTSFGSKQGIITGGQITASSFTLKGVENQNTACPGEALTTVTITGTCGSGVDIFFSSAAGERGQYVGTVNCF